MRRWFLPDAPDVLGMLREQADITAEGIDAFASWSHGEPQAGDRVREAEHMADDSKRRVVAAVREAFTTPLDPEDLFEVSSGMDEVLNAAKNAVREAEALGVQSDERLRAMCDLIQEGVRFLREALHALGRDAEAASEAAVAATKTQRRLERVYRGAMADLAASDDLRTVVASQELYRRAIGISEQIMVVAERIQYSTVKES